MNAAGAKSQSGSPEVDHDHDSLAYLLERVADVCCETASRRSDCAACAQERDRCAEALAEIATKLATIVLAHLHRESASLEALPPTPAVNAHCERHRRAYVEFSTRHNEVVGSLDRRNVLAGARKLEEFLCDCVRSHALEYDAALADLLKAKGVCADKFVISPWIVRQECRGEQCGEVLRINDEANRLRALLARVIDHLPDDNPLATESRAALD